MRKHKGRLEVLDNEKMADPLEKVEERARKEVSQLYVEIYKSSSRGPGVSRDEVERAVAKSIYNTRAYREDSSGHLYSLL